MVAGQSVVLYATGFMLGSAALHGLGLVAGNALQRLPLWVGRTVAALMAASGVVMLATRL
jgi:urease accessory protein